MNRVLAEGSTLLTGADGIPTSLGLFSSELLGTFVLILLGAGVCAATSLNKSHAKGAGWVAIAFGWGFAVFAAVFVSAPSGAHLNPAVTIGQWVAGNELTKGVPATFANMLIYFAAQMLGALLGAVACWLAYKKQFDEPAENGVKLGVFSTGPAIRSYGWNLVSEIIGTFVLIGFVVASGQTPSGLGPLAVALVVVSIGFSLGGPTGYAINPARDLGPRIAHALLPIPGKGTSDWSYAWVPIVGPIIGAILAALIVPAFLGI
ncbi:MIP/aquaporin family protein [uncultured Rothia sp.]|uniref:MIP/aquaporin family protein n=1 Tax=uncultured Rothia sp. TaxID=316088 RepID=UPI003217B2B9